jgi:NadR type nicotinamide-nucleotide adenylyltransferase
MEKSKGNSKRIILTGPESTGKTMLSTELAARFNMPFIPEYAREYILNLGRQYTYNDVVHIAKKQVELMEFYSAQKSEYLFIDTYLIITKVWFDKVFHRCPEWIDIEISKTINDLYLLCRPDIPWVPDRVRENGGHMREVLFDLYENELKNAGLNYAYVEGDGEDRIKNAILQINTFYLKR